MAPVLALGFARWYQDSVLDRLARKLFTVDKVASAVVVGASLRGTAGWATGIGASGRLDGRPEAPSATIETWFDLASLTKPILALTAARLARRGDIDLAAPLGVLLPEALGTPSEGVALEHFLAHRAGLDADRALFRGLREGKLTARRQLLVEAARARRRDAAGDVPPAGFAPVYSDMGYVLVGEALARVTATPLDVLVEQQVLEPLGATIGSARRVRARNARFTRLVAATEVVAWRGGALRGVVHDGKAWALTGESTSGHAGLFGTASGVLAIGRAVVDTMHGRADHFLTAQQIAPLVRPRPGGTQRAGFDGKSERGSLAGTKFGPSTIGHLGFTGTSMWCDVERELVGIVLTNRVHPTSDNARLRKALPSAYDAIADWATTRCVVAFPAW